MKLPRFQTKVVGLMIAVVVAAQLVTLLVVQVATERSVATLLQQDLRVGQRVWERFFEQRGSQLLENAAVLADDFGFKSAVASGDPPTMRSVLANHGSRVGAEYALLLSPQGRLMASLGSAPAAEQEAAVMPLLAQARGQGYAMAVIEMDASLYRMTLVPVLAPDLIGWVGIGTDFGDAFARDFRGVTGLDASFFTIQDDHPRVHASSLEQAQRQALQDLPAAALRADGDVRELRSGELDYLVLVEHLDPGAGDDVAVLLQGSLDAAMAPYQALQRKILALSGLAALAALLVAALLGRTVTRPIGQLAAAVRRVRGGDYTTPIEVRGRDEIADLASAFGSMQQEIGAREERILFQAHHDGLTGLPNRTCARERLAGALSRPRGDGDGFAVLILDLDGFKEINDTLGHDFADEVLAVLAVRLAEGVRAGDLVARLGGDEFMLLLEGVTPADALVRGNGLLAHLRQPLELPRSRINLDASIGVALFPSQGADADTLLRRADIALYDAKAAHQGVALYQAGRDELHLRKLLLMGDLRQSIERGELSLRFQPKLDVASSQVVHVEALLRWQHASLGPIGPDEFIPLAEHSGFIHEITRFVLDSSLAANARWRRGGVDLGLAVNLSAMDLLDADLPEYLMECLQRHGVPAGNLVLEVTEGALMRDVEYAIRMLQRLRAIGIRLAIDDFGTGYSSLAQLKRMPVDELKIDKSFVMQMTRGSDDDVIVRSTIELGHNMGLSVIAEGVETDAAMQLLREYRCDMVQGYLFSAALDEPHLLAWCRDAAAHGARARRGAQAGAVSGVRA